MDEFAFADPGSLAGQLERGRGVAVRRVVAAAGAAEVVYALDGRFWSDAVEAIGLSGSWKLPGVLDGLADGVAAGHSDADLAAAVGSYEPWLSFARSQPRIAELVDARPTRRRPITGSGDLTDVYGDTDALMRHVYACGGRQRREALRELGNRGDLRLFDLAADLTLRNAAGWTPGMHAALKRLGGRAVEPARRWVEGTDPTLIELGIGVLSQDGEIQDGPVLLTAVEWAARNQAWCAVETPARGLGRLGYRDAADARHRHTTRHDRSARRLRAHRPTSRQHTRTGTPPRPLIRRTHAPVPSPPRSHGRGHLTDTAPTRSGAAQGRPKVLGRMRRLWWHSRLQVERGPAMPYTIRPLAASTWDAFAELVERNNGVFGGCWCIGYHPECGQKGISHRAVKEDRVRTDRAHAALVFDEAGAAQGWCQYGNADELPGIKHKREYEKDTPPRPDWRITCFYVDKKHRGQGVARAALEGALDQIAQLGGGLVEAISEVTTGREAPGRFLFSATVELFDQYGFTRGRQVGKHAWIVSRVVEPV